LIFTRLYAWNSCNAHQPFIILRESLVEDLCSAPPSLTFDGAFQLHFYGWLGFVNTAFIIAFEMNDVLIDVIVLAKLYMSRAKFMFCVALPTFRFVMNSDVVVASYIFRLYRSRQKIIYTIRNWVFLFAALVS